MADLGILSILHFPSSKYFSRMLIHRILALVGLLLVLISTFLLVHRLGDKSTCFTRAAINCTKLQFGCPSINPWFKLHSNPSLSMGPWFQEPTTTPQMLKSAGDVLHMKWYSICMYPTHTLPRLLIIPSTM
jgi:hypothetical protein